jgi:hypothetical protein
MTFGSFLHLLAESLLTPNSSNQGDQTVRSSEEDKYRTLDNEEDYAFSFEEQPDGTWRVYILAQPDYRGRQSDSHATHRLRDEDRQFICWSAPIRSKTDAKTVASQWAEATQRYIKTGQRF